MRPLNRLMLLVDDFCAAVIVTGSVMLLCIAIEYLTRPGVVL